LFSRACPFFKDSHFITSLYQQDLYTMRVSVAIALLLAQQEAQGFAPSAFGVARSNTLLNAEIRDPTEKADTLRLVAFRRSLLLNVFTF